MIKHFVTRLNYVQPQHEFGPNGTLHEIQDSGRVYCHFRSMLIKTYRGVKYSSPGPTVTAYMLTRHTQELTITAAAAVNNM